MAQTGGSLASKENEIAHLGRSRAWLWTHTMTIGGRSQPVLSVGLSHAMREPVEKTGRAPVGDSCPARRPSRCREDVRFLRPERSWNTKKFAFICRIERHPGASAESRLANKMPRADKLRLENHDSHSNCSDSDGSCRESAENDARSFSRFSSVCGVGDRRCSLPPLLAHVPSGPGSQNPVHV